MLAGKRRSGLWLIVAGVVMALSCGTVCGDDAKDQSEKDQKDYRKTSDQILMLGTTVNLSKEEQLNRMGQLETMGQEVEKNWADRNIEKYGRLMFKLSVEISGMDVPAETRNYIAQGLALRALEKADKMPLGVHCDLLGMVGINVGKDGKPLKGNDWAELRKRLATLQLVGWQRIEKTIDESWNPDDWPVLNVLPPSGVEGPPGMDPEDIKDPKLRAEYEAAIEANNQKIARYSLQYQARNIQAYWVPATERFLVEVYMAVPDGSNPDGFKELEALLNTYVADEAKRARILDAVKKGEIPDDLH